MRFLPALYRAGNVERFHTMSTHKRQTLADHSWGVLMIIAHVSDGPVGHQLMGAALCHDLAESVTGDVPYTAKRASGELVEALSAVEMQFDRDFDIVYKLTEEEVDLLRWADMMELMMYCLGEYEMGNKRIMSVVQTARLAINRLGFPTTKARELYVTVSEQFRRQDV